MKNGINEAALDAEIDAMKETESFSMEKDEMEDAKKGGYNPFFDTKSMEYDKQYKFRVVCDKITVRELEDKFAKKKTKRLILAIEDLENGIVYDLVTRKDPNTETKKYSSLTLAVRRFYALSNGNIKDKMIAFTKNSYTHEVYGKTDGYNIKIIDIKE